MKAIRKHLVLCTLFVSGAIAQTTPRPAALQNVTVGRDAHGLRVEVTLSAPVQPSIKATVNPNRILLDLPATTSNGQFQKEVNSDGVRKIYAELHGAVPPIARIVIDLDQAHPYTMNVEGNRIIVTVGPAPSADAAHSTAPARPVKLGLSGIFRRQSPSPQSTTAGQPGSIDSQGTASSEISTATAGTTVSAKPSSPPPPFSDAQVGADSKSRDDSVATRGFPSATSDLPNASAQTPVKGTTFDAKADASTGAPSRAINTDPKAVTSQPADNVTLNAASPEASVNPVMVMVRSDDPSLHTVFRVKYVAEGVAYLEGGRAQGLAERMKLEVKDSNLPARQGDSVNAEDPQVVAELEVNGVAETSAVTDIHSPKRPVKVGDLAYLSGADAEALVAQRALSPTRQYPAVVSFSEGDTLDEEAREEVPRPPLPSVNRARGRIGLDYVTTTSGGASGMTSSNVGFAFRGDITRIGGIYWNLSGYYRGRMTSQRGSNIQTVQDLINHTYHLSMTYDNPNSSLVAGFGRLYLPWASSLDTIDGGYFGKRLSKETTVGIFGGSTPDPTSWNYNPNRVIGGGFVNFEGGDYNTWHYSSTSGGGINMVNWTMNRPFVFFEDSVSYSRKFALYEAAQLDSPAGTPATPAPGAGLGRSFFTLRVQPHPRVELDFNHNYFRDVPTYNPTIIPTGLVDKYLFQGVSVGARVEVPRQIFLSSTIGRSNGAGDKNASLNEMFGITANRLPILHLRADARYARFNSSFGSGSYEAVSFSRQMSETLRLEVLAGQQNFSSTLSTANRSRFITATWEKTMGAHYYVQGNFTVNRGNLNYQQWMFSLGYRFDNKAKSRNE